MNNIDMTNIITEIKDDEALDLGNNLSTGEKARILENTLGKMGIKPVRKSLRKRAALLVIAAVFVLGVTTAYATGVFGWDNRLSKIFGINQSNKDLVDGSWLMINQFDEENGVKIEIVSAIGDKYNVYITGEITLPEGADMTKTYSFGSFSFPIRNFGSGGMSVQFLEDEDTNDNIIPFIVNISRERGVKGKKCSVEIKDIVALNESSKEVVYPGTWNISWMLDYDNTSIEYHLNAVLNISNKEVTINKVSVSPLSVTVKAGSGIINELIDRYFSSSKGGELYAESLRIDAVVLSDGTRIDDFNGGNTSSNGFNATSSVTFARIINPEEVKSVIVNGTEIPLK